MIEVNKNNYDVSWESKLLTTDLIWNYWIKYIRLLIKNNYASIIQIYDIKNKQNNNYYMISELYKNTLKNKTHVLRG